MKEENWKPIKDFEGYYEISNFGRVKSLDRVIESSNGINKKIKERILKPSENKSGYLTVILQKNNKSKTCKVHRLVAEAFIPNPDNLPCIDHINTIRTDNRVNNLRWVTQKENCNNELSKKNYSEAQKGRTLSEETKKKLSEIKKGKKHTEETKNKLKGHEVSEETRKKISEGNMGNKNALGHKLTEENKKKIGKSNSKKVYCVELDKIFNSIKEASEELNISLKHMSEACKGRRKTCGGYHWKYVDNK